MHIITRVIKTEHTEHDFGHGSFKVQETGTYVQNHFHKVFIIVHI